MSWDGDERRKVNQDSINRDRLLERVDANVTNLLESHRILNHNFINHAENDERRFRDISNKIAEVEKKDAFFYGKVYGGTAILTAGLTFAIKMIFK